MTKTDFERQAFVDLSRILGKSPYFDTSVMRCSVQNIVNETAYMTLQIPLKTGVKRPNDNALGQLVAQLLHNESIVRQRELYDYAFGVMTGSIPPSQICRHNKAVDDSICYFMRYQIQVKTDSQKAVIEVIARLDVAKMQSYYL